MEEISEAHSRPSESRVREAANLNGVEYLVVACPKDYVMFADALKTTGLEGRLAVKDLTELVEEAVGLVPGVAQQVGASAPPLARAA